MGSSSIYACIAMHTCMLSLSMLNDMLAILEYAKFSSLLRFKYHRLTALTVRLGYVKYASSLSTPGILAA